MSGSRYLFMKSSSDRHTSSNSKSALGDFQNKRALFAFVFGEIDFADGFADEFQEGNSMVLKIVFIDIHF